MGTKEMTDLKKLAEEISKDVFPGKYSISRRLIAYHSILRALERMQKETLAALVEFPSDEWVFNALSGWTYEEKKGVIAFLTIYKPNIRIAPASDLEKQNNDIAETGLADR